MFDILLLPASFVFIPIVLAAVFGTMVGAEESVVLTVPKWRRMKEAVSQGYKLPARAVIEQFCYNAAIWAVIVVAVVNTEAFNLFTFTFAIMSIISSWFKYKHRHKFSFLPNWTVYHSIRYCALIMGILIGIVVTTQGMS